MDPSHQKTTHPFSPVCARVCVPVINSCLLLGSDVLLKSPMPLVPSDQLNWLTSWLVLLLVSVLVMPGLMYLYSNTPSLDILKFQTSLLQNGYYSTKFGPLSKRRPQDIPLSDHPPRRSHRHFSRRSHRGGVQHLAPE